MSSRSNDPQSTPAVNWDAPPTKDLVERAFHDGLSDPAKIAAWAKDRFKIDVPLAEIEKILHQLQKKEHKH